MNNTTITGLNNAVNNTDIVLYNQLIKVNDALLLRITALENNNTIDDMNNTINTLILKVNELTNTNIELNDKIDSVTVKTNSLYNYFFKGNDIPKK